MSRDVSVWVLAAGGILAAFGLLRVYSIYFADEATRNDLVGSGQLPVSWAALVVGLVLVAAGWWLRRSKQGA